MLRPFVAVALACASASLVASAGAEEAAHDLELKLELVAAQSDFPALPPDLVVSGHWPNACVPQLARSTMADWNIDVELRSSGHDCPATPTPISLRFNPAHEAGQRQMPVGVYEVRFYLSHGNGFGELIAFELLRAGWRESDFQPESGFWWSTPVADRAFLAGSGLSIEQQGENLAASLFSYESGNAVWYFGNTRVAGTLARVPMVRMFGGDSPFSASGTPPQLQPALTLHLNFLSPSHAAAWLARPQPGIREGIEVQSLDLQRLPFEGNSNGTAWKGQWALVKQESRQADLYDMFEVVTSDAERFSLRASGSSVELECRLESIGAYPIPTFCSLLDGADVLADFNKIGFDRLIGRTPDGQNARLVRLPQ